MSKRSQIGSKITFGHDLNGITQNAVFPEHVNEFLYRPRTLVDETLETIDPTPDIHGMFMQFNQLFFWRKLDTIYVRWSQRMTTCAGTCTFHPRNRECVIALSAPLLKLRPRKDLVETLLHEMIHGYLFVTNNNRDRDGHGPEFCKHMFRINKAAGTNITIYHSFHGEVRLYQQHWWKCDGPCKNRHPYYGTVRRAMNRAPGPSDFWWAQHQATCGGKFIKVREPEKSKARSNATSASNTTKTNTTSGLNTPKPKQIAKPLPNQGTLDSFISGKDNCPCSPRSPRTSSLGSTGIRSIFSTDNGVSNANVSGGIKKLGNSRNNVFGFGTGGPGSCNSPSTSNKPGSKPTRGGVNFIDTLGGSGAGRSRLLDLYLSSPKPASTNLPQNMASNDADDHNTNDSQSLPQCPICDQTVPGDINSHLDLCLNGVSVPKRPKLDKHDKNLQECPMCGDKFAPDQINTHIELCLPDPRNETTLRGVQSSEIFESTRREPEATNSQTESSLPQCPICNGIFPLETINDHVDICLFAKETNENLRSQLENSPTHYKMDHSGDKDQLETVDLTDSPRRSNAIICATCDKAIESLDYYDHVLECLAQLRDQNLRPDEVIEIADEPGSSRRNGASSHYKCLVCGDMVANNIPLEVHLETCVQVAYGDSSDSLEELEDGNVSKDNTVAGSSDKMEFCPICMELFPEKLIAAHVNKCDKFKI